MCKDQVERDGVLICGFYATEVVLAMYFYEMAQELALKYML